MTARFEAILQERDLPWIKVTGSRSARLASAPSRRSLPA
jgi:hypothetical protein